MTTNVFVFVCVFERVCVYVLVHVMMMRIRWNGQTNEAAMRFLRGLVLIACFYHRCKRWV